MGYRPRGGADGEGAERTFPCRSRATENLSRWITPTTRPRERLAIDPVAVPWAETGISASVTLGRGETARSPDTVSTENRPVGGGNAPHAPISSCHRKRLSRVGANRPACRPRAAIIKNDVEGAGTQFVLDGGAAPDRDLRPHQALSNTCRSSAAR